jgi:predicted nucleic acid-binding Zn ribbon protein
MSDLTACRVSCERCGVHYETTLRLRGDGWTRCEFCGGAAQAVILRGAAGPRSRRFSPVPRRQSVPH